jgi:hypothetical protein
MKVGDMVKMSHAGGYWVGWIVELPKSPWAVIWRPGQGFQTCHMEKPNSGLHQIEVINENESR